MQGKPYAGNPHVRFDEGAGALRHSGRSALLYNRVIRLVIALAAMAVSVVVCGTAQGAPILLKARTIEPEKEAAKPRLMAT